MGKWTTAQNVESQAATSRVVFAPQGYPDAITFIFRIPGPWSYGYSAFFDLYNPAGNPMGVPTPLIGMPTPSSPAGDYLVTVDLSQLTPTLRAAVLADDATQFGRWHASFQTNSQSNPESVANWTHYAGSGGTVSIAPGTVILSCTPDEASMHVYLNGVEQYRPEDWNIVQDGTQWKVVPTAAMDVRSGDLVECRYVCDSGLL